MADQTRMCSRCGKEQPLDEQHFRFHKGSFSAYCQTCRKEEGRTQLKKNKARRSKALQRLEDAGVALWAQQATAGGSNIPHSAEVIERVIQYFGGVGGFSAMLVKQYYDAAPGSSARNRLIETICRLVSKNVDQGGARRPLTLWTEEELEAELQTRMQQAVLVLQGEVEHGKETAPARITAPDSGSAGTDAVSAGRDQESPSGASGPEDRSPAALQAEPEPRSGSPMHGE